MVGMVMIVLIVIIAIFAFMNREMAKDTQGVHENAEIIIKGDGSEVKFTLDEITQLGQEEFTATLDSSNSDPEEYSYTGIPLMNLIEEAGMTVEDKQQVIIRAVDGYTVALKPNEVKDKDNVYLAYKKEGKFLKDKEKGGSGPYQVIIRKDQFSQRWCKFTAEIELK